MSKFVEKDYGKEGLNFKIWIDFIKLIKPFHKILYTLFIIQIILAIGDVIIPLFNSILIDNYTNGLDIKIVMYFGIFYMIVITILSFMHYFYFKNCGKLEMNIAYFLRDKLFNKLMNLSFSFFDVTPSGWLLSRITSDIARLADIFAWWISEFAWAFPMMIFSCIIMFKTNVSLSIIVIITTPIIVLLSYLLQKLSLKTYREVRKYNSKVTNGFSEGIMGAQTSKSLNLDEYNLNDFRYDSDDLKASSIANANVGAIFRPLMNFVTSLVIALIIYYGGLLSIENVISFGTLLLFVQYANQFYDPIRSMAMALADLQNAKASLERVMGLLSEEEKIKDDQEVIDKYGDIYNIKSDEELKGSVSFKHVDFEYVKDHKILEDFNLEVKPKQTIALVGDTGSGKSTIINLLCRFYEPTKGEILIDGVDYRQRSIAWLSSKIGYVLQSPHLFSGSIKDNIRFGNDDIKDEDIIRVCKMIKAHDFIMKLDKAYDTNLNEGGSNLSLGQKQLLSFARALILNPSIFILDEATSSIDTETEHIIQYAIDNIINDKTTFIVAHRLSTIEKADRILVIKKGKIIEDGSHKELLAKKGQYYQMYCANQIEDSLK